MGKEVKVTLTSRMDFGTIETTRYGTLEYTVGDREVSIKPAGSDENVDWSKNPKWDLATSQMIFSDIVRGLTDAGIKAAVEAGASTGAAPVFQGTPPAKANAGAVAKALAGPPTATAKAAAPVARPAGPPTAAAKAPTPVAGKPATPVAKPGGGAGPTAGEQARARAAAALAAAAAAQAEADSLEGGDEEAPGEEAPGEEAPEEEAAPEEPVKRGRGRPKGAPNKPKGEKAAEPEYPDPNPEGEEAEPGAEGGNGEWKAPKEILEAGNASATIFAAVKLYKSANVAEAVQLLVSLRPHVPVLMKMPEEYFAETMESILFKNWTSMGLGA